MADHASGAEFVPPPSMLDDLLQRATRLRDANIDPAKYAFVLSQDEGHRLAVDLLASNTFPDHSYGLPYVIEERRWQSYIDRGLGYMLVHKGSVMGLVILIEGKF